jgi:hypothetical protein
MGKTSRSASATTTAAAGKKKIRALSTRAGLCLPAYKTKKLLKLLHLRVSKRASLYETACVEFLLRAVIVRAQRFAGIKADGAPKGIKTLHLHLALQDKTQVYYNIFPTGVAGIHRVLEPEGVVAVPEAEDEEDAE